MLTSAKYLAPLEPMLFPVRSRVRRNCLGKSFQPNCWAKFNAPMSSMSQYFSDKYFNLKDCGNLAILSLKKKVIFFWHDLQPTAD